MKYTFDKISWEQFELICGSLLVAEGFSELRQFAKPGAADRGIDWVFESAEGTT